MSSTLTPEAKEILASSKEQYLRLIPTTKAAAEEEKEEEAQDAGSETAGHHVPPWQIPAQLVVSAAIFRRTAGGAGGPRVLLLRRSPEEEHLPGAFELPGGKVEDADFCISDALAREVREETGLRVTKVIGVLPEMRYRVAKKKKKKKKNFVSRAGAEMAPAGDEVFSGSEDNVEGEGFEEGTGAGGAEVIETAEECLQLSYAVLTDDAEVVLNGGEHSEFVWAAGDMLGIVEMTEEMRRLVDAALSWAERHGEIFGFLGDEFTS